MSTLTQVKVQLVNLETEKQHLLLDLDKERALTSKLTLDKTTLKDNLRASKARLNRLFTDFDKTQKKIDEISSQFSLLKAENAALTSERDVMKQENENLKAKFGSAEELKKALREVRKQIVKVGKQMIHKGQEVKTSEGNRGFVIKDGQPTYPAKIKIEVNPASAKE